MEVLGATQNQTPILGLDTWKPPVVPKSSYVTQQEEENKGIITEEIKTQPLSDAVLSMQEQNVEPTTAASALQDIGAKNAIIERLVAKGTSLTYEDVKNSADPGTTAAYFRRQLRIQEAANRLNDLIEADGGSVLDTVEEFLYDALVDPVLTAPQALTLGGGSATTASEDWSSALTLSDKEWDTFLNNKISELQSPAWSDSSLTTSQLAVRSLAGLESQGYVAGDEANAFVNSALSVVDFIPVGALSKLGKLPLSDIGKGVISRVRSARGVEEATEVATKLVPTANAQTASSVMPTALQASTPTPPPNLTQRASVGSLRGSTALPQAVPTASFTPPTPTVSQGTLVMSTFKNRFLEQFQKGWLAGSFGKAGWEDNAFSWASAKATAISQAAGTEVVNIGAITDDLAGTFRTEVTYGKMGATPFTSYNDAVKFSQRIPNSKVVESATGTPVTKGSVGYTYYVTAATPVEIVAGKTNELKESLSLFGRFFGSSSTIGNWFGTANRGIQDDLNNLAFQADFGGNKLQNFIQSELIPAYSKLNKENQGALTDIFHTMSDSKRTTWLDQAEFSHEYQAITGKMPSREVIQVYELTVEASDAAYYFKATEHLRAMNSKNTLMFDAKGKGFWEQVYPDKSARNTIGKVRNAKTGAVVDAHTLPPETVIYTYVEGKQGRVKSVYNVQGMTRLPTHSDALAYNAGGPRSNPYVTHFIGTVNDVNTATGKGSSWGTLIGAKSEKESISAVKEVNKIQSGASILKTKGITLDPANPYNGLTAAEGQALDNLVAANNTWMPQLTNWKDYVEFLSGRGVSIGEPVVWKRRNAKLLEFIDYQDDFLIHKNLDSYIEYKRHDLALMNYGGERSWNPNPVQSITRQLRQSVSAAAHTQWRIEAGNRFMQKIDKYKDWKKTGQVLEIKGLGPYTPEVQIRHMEIVGNSAIAQQLRREQSVFIRRANMYAGSVSENPYTKNIRGWWTKSTDSLIEAVYNGTEWDFIRDKVVPELRDARDSIGGGLMSIGFMTKMTSFSTFFVQAAAAYQIAAVTPRNASKAAALAMYVRKLADDPNAPKLYSGFRGNLARMAGLSDTDFQALLDHFTASGRGFTRGAVVDDPEALPGIAKNLFGRLKQKAGEVARTPYYAGENFSQTVSRVAAYLDTVERFPAASRDSKLFWDAVISRDRALSLSMNKSSSSMSQTDSITRFFTQFAHFNFRAIETVFFEKELTLAERARLGLSMTVLWGWAGMGLSPMFEGEDGSPDGVVEKLIKYGPIDAMLNEYAGFTVGSRIGLNLPQLFARASITDASDNYTIPGLNIASSAGGAFMSAMGNFMAGQGELGMYDLGRLVRTWKTLDDAYMAYTMAMSDVRTTVGGSSLPSNYTNSEVLFQALGFKPEKVNELYRLNQKGFAVHDRSKKASKAALPVVKLASEKASEGDWQAAAELMQDAGAIIDAYNLPPTVKANTIKSVMQDAGEDRIEMMVLSCIKAECGLDALNFVEGLK